LAWLGVAAAKDYFPFSLGNSDPLAHRSLAALAADLRSADSGVRLRAIVELGRRSRPDHAERPSAAALLTDLLHERVVPRTRLTDNAYAGGGTVEYDRAFEALARAGLEKLRLTGADLSGLSANAVVAATPVSFYRCSVNYSRFVRSSFHSCYWGNRLVGAWFSECELVNINFARTDLTGSAFPATRLQYCMFSEANLTGVDFSRAILQEPRFGPTASEPDLGPPTWDARNPPKWPAGFTPPTGRLRP
jgi:Pentapeptide repeats (9 copies)